LLSILRNSYLLTYDPLQFHAYLETLISSNTTTASGAAKQHQSPWMLTDAAHIIFQSAKRRCYTMTTSRPAVIDIDDDEDAWAALDEAEGIVPTSKKKGNGTEKRPWWLPAGMDPVLEELPKWNLLAEIIQEAEEEMIRQEMSRKTLSDGESCLFMGC
jgi:DNA excision repair protein ERCC-4